MQDNSFNAALVQMPVCADRKQNVKKAVEMISRAASDGAQMIVLPEMFSCLYESRSFVENAEEAGGETWQAMAESAAKNGVYLVAGSFPEKAGGKLYNSSFVFGPNGSQLAFHRKAHLFDINVPGGQVFKESDTFTAGDKATVFETPWGIAGLCICFDMRFSELATAMTLAGAKLIVVPAAFNMTTGPAHWETMFRQRAVDNQVYTIGVAPARDCGGPYVSYGHSIVCSPWGRIEYQADFDECIGIVKIDPAEVVKIRAQLPILSSRNPELYSIR